MKSTIALALALLTTTLPITAAAQSAAGSGDLQLEKKGKRAVVLPKQSPEKVRSEADRAIDEFAASKNTGPLVDQTSPVKPSARPDLNYDVKSGIQGQRLNDATRNR